MYIYIHIYIYTYICIYIYIYIYTTLANLVRPALIHPQVDGSIPTKPACQLQHTGELRS